MKRAVLYLLVSTLDQTTVNQERELREVASRTGLWPAITVMPKFKPADATDLFAVAAQDALNRAVSGRLIGAVQPLIRTPMHARRLFRKWLQKVYTPVQTHSNFLCFCEPTPTS